MASAVVKCCRFAERWLHICYTRRCLCRDLCWQWILLPGEWNGLWYVWIWCIIHFGLWGRNITNLPMNSHRQFIWLIKTWLQPQSELVQSRIQKVILVWPGDVGTKDVPAKCFSNYDMLSTQRTHVRIQLFSNILLSSKLKFRVSYSWSHF